MKEKKKSYAKYVKEIHWPDISVKKHEELEFLKQNIKHHSRQPRPLYKNSSIIRDRSISEEKLLY